MKWQKFEIPFEEWDDDPNPENRSIDHEKIYEILPPFTLVKFKDGDIELIGHINKYLGGCDCCGRNVRDIIEFVSIKHLVEKFLTAI